jgi:hypothetical protein
MEFNIDQFKAITDRTVAVVGTLVALAGIVPADKWAVFAHAVRDSIGPVASVISTAVVVGSLIRGWLVNRTKSKVAAVAALPPSDAKEAFKQMPDATKIAATRDIPRVRGVVADKSISNSPEFIADPKVVSSPVEVRS